MNQLLLNIFSLNLIFISLLLASNGIRRAVYVGDTAKDLAAARAAGIPFLFASWGFGALPEDQPSLTRFSELVEAVASMRGS